MKASAWSVSLFAEAQSGDNGAISLHILSVEIGELSPSLPDHLEKPAERVVVMLVELQVLGEPVDSLR
jgi:hypothetical protein